ncbi:pyridine nucleotide-disulfide oxidoreductase family protein [Rhizobium sp. RU20A]|uniref:FAD-dependent oxidoreductase n=1 Tax=Rhizobium sp. RU20A TaxID=1907412 RepID=UPI000955F95D|nr:FAD-dependent oxidoreductase [Rhizobium sp. RU20A]SIR18655.1 pyridine nucleotide-disulfide oxidoreductase family protein [Rhizobium sp. RU20A]
MAEATDMPILLVGGGHAHVEVVRRLGRGPVGRKIILISPARHAPYSGMLPGYVSGRYGFADFHIDLDALCARCNVTFLATSAGGIDPDRRQVSLADGQVLDYCLLSIDIGSTPQLPADVSGGLSVKPIASFTQRLAHLDARVAQSTGRLRLAVVGQGVAGVEMAFALQRRFGAGRVDMLLVGRADAVIAERSRLARAMVRRELARAGIAHHQGFDVIGFDAGTLLARDGRTLSVDDVVWTTSSGAPAWLGGTGLALDAGGFIRVDQALRSVSHPDVFAAGDVASLPDPRPKAGVFAVRQGPVLADNLRRCLAGEDPRPFRPQRQWLALIALANGRAIADKWCLAASGRWVARWKHWNDSRFVRLYQDPDGQLSGSAGNKQR